jgi:hypothetical protein
MLTWTNLRLTRASIHPAKAVLGNLAPWSNHSFALTGCVHRGQWRNSACLAWFNRRNPACPSVGNTIIRGIANTNWQPDPDFAGHKDKNYQDLLYRAAKYAILDLGRLDFESSVPKDEDWEPRLIHHPKYQFDYDLWAILLHYRMRRYGDHGVKSIWQALTLRKHTVKQSPSWPMADSLWDVFVDLGLRDHRFMESIAEHIKDLWQTHNLRRPSLYVEVIGGLIGSETPEAAPKFSPMMHPGTVISSDELLAVFFRASTSPSSNTLEDFRAVCISVPFHKIYADVVKTLCERSEVEQVMKMHGFLVQRGDLPTAFDAITPLVRRLARGNLDASPLIRSLEQAGVYFGGQIRRLYASVKDSKFGFTREDVDLATRKTFGVRRFVVSDAFAARFFATKSFSFEFALNGLRVLGLEEVGPLSLREIALQSDTPMNIRQRICKLDESGIDTGGSAYSRVLRNLLREKRDALFMDVVNSDQHPDVFEDLEVQSQLLHSSHKWRNWRQLNQTLAVLRPFGDTEKHAPNALLRGALLRKDRPEIDKVASGIIQSGSYISKANLILMYQTILRTRPRTRRAPLNRASNEELAFLITIWQRSLKAGTRIPPDAWREPLRRLSMMGSWMQLEKTCFWLCSFYSSRCKVSLTGDSVPDKTIFPLDQSPKPLHHTKALDEIFSPSFQKVIVEWGFLSGIAQSEATSLTRSTCGQSSNGSHEPPWARGVRLLCGLRHHYGLRLHDAAVEKGFKEGIRRLFSRRRSRLRHKRQPMTMNQTKPSEYISLINTIYGRAILDEHMSFIPSKLLAAHPTKRQNRRKIWRPRSKAIKETQQDISTQQSATNSAQTDGENSVVMYRDLFHASWEDYQPQTHKNKN